MNNLDASISLTANVISLMLLLDISQSYSFEIRCKRCTRLWRLSSKVASMARASAQLLTQRRLGVFCAIYVWDCIHNEIVFN